MNKKSTNKTENLIKGEDQKEADKESSQYAEQHQKAIS